jgi:hypothetical protein
MESKEHRNARLKAMRRKYHLGEFKNTRKVYKVHHSNYSMAKKRKSHSRKSGTSGLMANALGVVGVIAWESIISPRIPINEPIKSVGELVLFTYLARKGGVVGNIGKAGVVIQLYHLASMYVSPLITNITGVGTSSSNILMY